MRKRFPGHYRPSEQEFAELWTECLFVFKTQTFSFTYLDMARKRERRSLIRLNDLSLCVWIPHRVGLEFQCRRRDVDRGTGHAYDSLEKDIEDQGHQLEALFNQYTRHQTIDAKQEIIKTLTNFVSA